MDGDWSSSSPGRCKHLHVPYSSSASSASSTLAVSILDAPLLHFRFKASRPFAAIFVPRGQELEWIFSSENGLWDLLLSASVSRLVVFRRLCQRPVHRDATKSRHYARVRSSHSESLGEEDEDDRGVCRMSFPTGNSFFNTLSESGKLVVDDDDDESFKKVLLPLINSLFPWHLCPLGPPSDPFVSYIDNVQTRILLEIAYSPISGDILVEDVELDCGSDYECRKSYKDKTVLRRRMRFRHMPNLIQTEVLIAIYSNGQLDYRYGLKDVREEKELLCELTNFNARADYITQVEVKLDHSKLVHRYLLPIVAGLVLASPCLEACTTSKTRARVLAIGIGGGALPSFLCRKFGFFVLALDIDEVVVQLARRHFGLEETVNLQVQVQDGVHVVYSIASHACKNGLVSRADTEEWQALVPEAAEEAGCNKCENSASNDVDDDRMHVIIVDVNVADPLAGVLSPPPCFLTRAFLLASRMALQDGGMLVMNVIPRDECSFKLVSNALCEFFSGIYQIQEEDNHVVFAFPSEIEDIDLSSSFAMSLANAVGGDWFSRIEEVS